MEDQKLTSSHQIQRGTEHKWEERFFIKRIDEEDIEITLRERDSILLSLNEGKRFIQIGKYTLMLNAIKSIDPKWGKDNIPPKPKEITENKVVDGKGYMTVLNQEEIDEWKILFGNYE